MKSLILLTILGVSTSLIAGVGGISGGHKDLQGGHINFQRESTFVSPVYSKTLCFDGVDFHATINKCAKERNGDSGGCERMIKVRATQPMESTRERCKRSGGGDNDHCQKWETVPFIQNPVRTVDVMNGDHVVKKVKVRVKSCN